MSDQGSLMKNTGSGTKPAELHCGETLRSTLEAASGKITELSENPGRCAACIRSDW
jgi:hypothetical protein